MLSKESIEIIKQLLSNKLYSLELQKEEKTIVYETYNTMKRDIEKALKEIEKE